MSELYLDALSDITSSLEERRDRTPDSETLTICFVDLCKSSFLKSEKGHKYGTKLTLKHNELCRKIANKFDCKYEKALGDGLILFFEDPLNSIKTALNIKKAIGELSDDIETAISITSGTIEILEDMDPIEFLGSSIDKCARMNDVAQEDQIVVDQSLIDLTRSWIKDYDEMILSESIEADLKGIGSTKLLELSTTESGFADDVDMPLIEEELSPVKWMTYPDFVGSGGFLNCDTCGEPLELEKSEGFIEITESDEEVIGISFFHKGPCDKSKHNDWYEFSQMTRPEKFMDVILTIFRKIDEDEKSLNDWKSIRRLFAGLYPYVFRKSSQKEQTQYILDWKLGI